MNDVPLPLQPALSVVRFGERFRRFVDTRPELLRRSSFAPFFAEMAKDSPAFCGVSSQVADPVQPWPIWLDAREARELATDVVGLVQIFRSLPARFFASDAARIARFLGMEETTAEMLLARPNLLEETLCRADFLLTADGFKLLEINLGNLGGWQHSIAAPRYLARPDVRDFLALEGLSARCFDSLRATFKHVVSHAVANPLVPGPLHLLIVTGNAGRHSPDTHPEAIYRKVLLSVLQEVAPGKACRLRIARLSEVEFPNGEVHVGGTRFHAVIEANDEEPSREIFRAFKAGLVHCYTSPLDMIIGDKLLLALVSSQGASDRFTPDEQRLLRRYLPWTREVTPAVASFEGDEGPLPELLRRHRERLVLKAGQGFGGNLVHVGRTIDDATWNELVDAAVAEGGWVAQRYLAGVPVELQYGEEGSAPFQLVWGLYVMGDNYGGAWIRLAPTSAGAVVNMARGARVGLVFEVEPGPPP